MRQNKSTNEIKTDRKIVNERRLYSSERNQNPNMSLNERDQVAYFEYINQFLLIAQIF